MTRSFALSTVVSVFVIAACSGPTSPTGAPSANAAALASTGAGAGNPSQPQSVPFKGTLSGTQSVTPLAFPFIAVDGSATGNATHLGLFTAHFPHTVNVTTRIGVGTYTFTAANGDTLTADFSGQASQAAVVLIEEHATVTGGTGRFEGATGSFTIERQFDQSTGATRGTVEGTISFRNGHP